MGEHVEEVAPDRSTREGPIVVRLGDPIDPIPEVPGDHVPDRRERGHRRAGVQEERSPAAEERSEQRTRDGEHGGTPERRTDDVDGRHRLRAVRREELRDELRQAERDRGPTDAEEEGRQQERSELHGDPPQDVGDADDEEPDSERTPRAEPVDRETGDQGQRDVAELYGAGDEARLDAGHPQVLDDGYEIRGEREPREREVASAGECEQRVRFDR
ncbi:MAG: hypothetical protein V5A62_18480 [Haloarculaceae archaeon]